MVSPPLSQIPLDLTKLEARARAVIDVCGRDGLGVTSVVAAEMAHGVLALLDRARVCETVTEALARLTDASLPVDLYLGLHGKMTSIKREDRESFCEAFRLALRALPHTPDAAEDYPT